MHPYNLRFPIPAFLRYTGIGDQHRCPVIGCGLSVSSTATFGHGAAAYTRGNLWRFDSSPIRWLLSAPQGFICFTGFARAGG